MAPSPIAERATRVVRIGHHDDDWVTMQLDDEICYCYHVTLRKLMNFSRRVRPEHPSQMTQCLNAGTGCGWCVPFLIEIAEDPDAIPLNDMTPEEYAEKRSRYRSSGQSRNTFPDGDA